MTSGSTSTPAAFRSAWSESMSSLVSAMPVWMPVGEPSIGGATAITGDAPGGGPPPPRPTSVMLVVAVLPTSRSFPLEDQDDHLADRTRLDELERLRTGSVREETLSPAEHGRKHHEAQLVDEVALE